MCNWPECSHSPKRGKPFCARHMQAIPADLRRVLRATLPTSSTHRRAVETSVRYARELLVAHEMEAARQSAFLADQGVLW